MEVFAQLGYKQSIMVANVQQWTTLIYQQRLFSASDHKIRYY